MFKRLPLQIKFYDNAFARSLLSSIQKPRAYVTLEIDGVERELYDCINFDINTDKDEILEGFNLTISNAKEWNSRVLLDVLSPGLNKRINIYYGHIIENKLNYIKIFSGIPTEFPESYSYGSSQEIKIQGKSLAWLLHNNIGDIESEYYTGYSKDLIKYWCNKLGLDVSLTYTDSIYFHNHRIKYSTILTAIHSFDLVLGPRKDKFFDPSGTFVWRDAPLFSLENKEFDYDSDSLISLSMNSDRSKIITVVDVIGADSNAIVMGKEAWYETVQKYGRIKTTRNNGLIATFDQADKLADDILYEGGLYSNTINLKLMSLNPYINIGSLIYVDEKLSSIFKLVKVFSANHTFKYGESCTTSVKGYYNG